MRPVSARNIGVQVPRDIGRMLETILSLGALTTGVIVILAKNPIHSVLALASTVSFVSVLIISSPTLSLEFLPILFVIVYVGAIAILFLFVIMMLNIRYLEVKDNATRYIPIGLIIGIIFWIEIYWLVEKNIGSEKEVFGAYQDWAQLYPSVTNIVQIGQFLYTDGYIQFLVSSLVLLVAMVSAIVLTLHHESWELVKRQDLFVQITRDQDIPRM